MNKRAFRVLAAILWVLTAVHGVVALWWWAFFDMSVRVGTASMITVFCLGAAACLTGINTGD